MPMSLFENPEVPLEIQKQLEDKFHLNDPLPVQYFYFISDIVAGLDFGVSVKLRPGLPVFGILINRLPPTILVNFLSLFMFFMDCPSIQIHVTILCRFCPHCKDVCPLYEKKYNFPYLAYI